MRLSRMTDYALVLLCQMAREDSTAVISSGRLAEATGLPGPSVSKLLKALAREGLVNAHRGAGGGYGLARSPQAITVADVVAALEGPVALAACVDGHCGFQRVCPSRGRWQPVNKAVHRALAGVSLAEMAKCEEA